MPKPPKVIYAKDLKCCKCGMTAEVFWPQIDIDIPSHPYCRTCVTKAQIRVFEMLNVPKNQRPAMLKK